MWPKIKYQDELLQAEKEAREKELGCGKNKVRKNLGKYLIIINI